MNATMDDALLYRTTDILETKHLLLQLAKKFEGRVDAPKTLGVTNKRKKDSEIETIWIRQLMCIPMISEGVARAIMKHFGNNINELREALKAPTKDFPDVQISPNTLLGKARIKKLAEVFS